MCAVQLPKQIFYHDNKGLCLAGYDMALNSELVRLVSTAIELSRGYTGDAIVLRAVCIDPSR